MREITLENSRGDFIRKVSGKWGFYRTGGADTFQSEEEALKAICEIEEQGKYVEDIEIVEW